MTTWNQGIFKKVPLPWSYFIPKNASPAPDQNGAGLFISRCRGETVSFSKDVFRLSSIMIVCFRSFHGERVSISTRERKEWAKFLHDRGIMWEVIMRNRPNWEGWEFVPTGGYYTCRPNGSEDCVRVNRYFIPEDLAMKMLVLGTLL